MERMSNVLRKVISLVCAITLVISTCALLSAETTVEIGSQFVINNANWGTQNNNNYYFMIRNKQTGAYGDMTYDSGNNNFSVPGQGLLFIQQPGWGLGSTPSVLNFFSNDTYNSVLGFKAPRGGTVNVSFQIRRGSPPSGDQQSYFKVNQNGSKIFPSDAANVTLTADSTLYTFSADVKKNTMLYFEVENLTMAFGDVFVDYYNIQYTAVNDLVENPVKSGDSFVIDNSKWGQQNNNNYYFMIRNKQTGAYGNMTYDSGNNNFSVPGQGLLFIQQPGWGLGSVPSVLNFFSNDSYNSVLGFMAPSGGNVSVSLQIRRGSPPSGNEQSYLKVNQNGDKIFPSDASNITLTSNSTLYTFTADVKKNTMLYIEVENLTMANGDVFVDYYNIQYNSVNDLVENPVKSGDSFVIDNSKWGQQNNNNYYFMAKNKQNSLYSGMTFDSGNNNFGISGQGLLFIQQPGWGLGSTPSVLNFFSNDSYNSVLGFKAPRGGTVSVSVQIRRGSPPAGNAQSYFKATKNGQKVFPAVGNNITLTSDSTLYTFTADVKMNTMLLLEIENLTLENGDVFIDYYNIQYASVNDLEEGALVLDNFNVSPANEITKVQPGSKVLEVKYSMFAAGDVAFAFHNLQSQLLGDSDNAGTGTTIGATQNGSTTTYTIVVYGEVTGDGIIDISDLYTMKQHVLKSQLLTGVCLKAGSISNDNSITISDLLSVKKHVLGIAAIAQY